MTAPELADTWTPHTITWRNAVEGDVLVNSRGELWAVDKIEPPVVTLQRGRKQWTGPVDADEEISVLQAIPETDALTLLRDELGAVLIERRAAA